MSIARAFYSDADVYLFDDPLSAVDAHVGAHIFSRMITGRELANRTRVLVTNQLQYLESPAVSRIVVMDGGRIVQQGTYSQLMATEGNFKRLVQLQRMSAAEADDDKQVTAVRGAGECCSMKETRNEVLAVCVWCCVISLRKPRSLTWALEMVAGSPLEALCPSRHVTADFAPPPPSRLVVGLDQWQVRAAAPPRVAVVFGRAVLLTTGSEAGVWLCCGCADQQDETQMTAAEHSATGAVKWSVYWRYLTSMGNPVLVVLIFSMFFVAEAGIVSSGVWYVMH